MQRRRRRCCDEGRLRRLLLLQSRLLRLFFSPPLLLLLREHAPSNRLGVQFHRCEGIILRQRERHPRGRAAPESAKHTSESGGVSSSAGVQSVARSLSISSRMGICGIGCCGRARSGAEGRNQLRVKLVEHRVARQQRGARLQDRLQIGAAEHPAGRSGCGHERRRRSGDCRVGNSNRDRGGRGSAWQCFAPEGAQAQRRRLKQHEERPQVGAQISAAVDAAAAAAAAVATVVAASVLTLLSCCCGRLCLRLLRESLPPFRPLFVGVRPRAPHRQARNDAR